MKIGIISDTHDNLRNTDLVLKALSKAEIDLLVHAGDWDMPFTMRIFTQVKVPIKAVLGNGDTDIQKFLYQLQNLPLLKDLKNLDIQPEMQDFSVDGRRVAVFHGDDENVSKVIIESQAFDLFCIGHDHKPNIQRNKKTLIVNPGSMVGFTAEQGIMPVMYGIYDTRENSAKLVEVKI